MEIQLEPEEQAQLEAQAAKSGSGPENLAKLLLEDSLAQQRDFERWLDRTLNERFNLAPPNQQSRQELEEELIRDWRSRIEEAWQESEQPDFRWFTPEEAREELDRRKRGFLARRP